MKSVRGRAWGPLGSGFTLIELLVVISIIALLIGILLPSLASAREAARRIQCSSQMRSLAQATEVYANDFDDFYVPRNSPSYSPPMSRWVGGYLDYLNAESVITCPTDEPQELNPGQLDPRDSLPRSFMFNGFNDASAAETGNAWTEADNFGMKRVLIEDTSGQVLFGEKDSEHPGYYVDIFAAVPDPFIDLALTRHGGGGASGVSNFAFADGHVTNFRFGEAIDQTYLWAVTSEFRRQ